MGRRPSKEAAQELAEKYEKEVARRARAAASAATSAAACAKKGSIGRRMQRPPELVSIPGCCLNVA